MWRNSQYRSYVMDRIRNNDDLVVLDTETTGLESKCQIIQFSAIRYHMDKVRGFHLAEKERINVFIKPDTPVPDKVVKKTRITNEFLSDMPCEKDVFGSIYDFLSRGGLLCAYNAPFDIDKINGLYERNAGFTPSFQVIDVLHMARDCISREETGGHSLQTIAEYLGCANDVHFHLAIEDVIATTNVFVHLLKKYVQMIREERENPQDRRKARLAYLYFWVNPRKKSMQRVVVKTTEGDFYYDAVARCWGNNKKSACTVEDIDMEDLEMQCLDRWTCKSMDELVQKTKEYQKNRKKAQ